MKVYDTNGNELKEYNLNIGYLMPSTKTEYHEEVKPIEEVYEIEEKHYPNGGISRRKIIIQEAVEGKAAWEEEVNIYVYTLYTEEELKKIKEEREKPTMEERVKQLEEALTALLEGATE